MSSSRLLAVLLLAAGLAGCGFRPLYEQGGANADVAAAFETIAIAQPEDRVTQVVRNHLLDMLTPRGTPERPRYRLELKVTESVSSVLVTRSDEVTRNNLQLQVQYRLVEFRSGALVSGDTVNTLTSYNLLRADFANLVSERDARSRAARDCAEQIRFRLGSLFNKPKPAGS